MARPLRWRGRHADADREGSLDAEADRATGEVAIREAVQEVRVWSQEAVFSLTEYEENGRKTPLIKDWKDLFLELGDKQSLLASLKESPFYRAFEDRGEFLGEGRGVGRGVGCNIVAISRIVGEIEERVTVREIGGFELNQF